MPFPANKPAYRRVSVDNEDRIWLQVYPTSGATHTVWIRLDPRTSRSHALRLPPRFNALAFTSTMVYGVWRDNDDVEHVQLYALPTM